MTAQPLIAGTAGDRPTGQAIGAAGHGNGTGFELHDRAGDPRAPLSEHGRAIHDRFVAAIDNDLDLPAALALVREVLRSRLPADERRWLVLDADVVLGLDLHRVWDQPARDETEPVPPEVAELLAERTRARAARDYARSDTLRDRLTDLGWDVVDDRGGSRVHPRTPAR